MTEKAPNSNENAIEEQLTTPENTVDEEVQFPELEDISSSENGALQVTSADAASNAAPDAEIYVDPVAPSQPQTPEGLSISRDAVNYFIVAALFLGLGVLLGTNIGGSGSIDESLLRQIIREEMGDLSESAQTVNFMEDDDPFIGPEDAPVVIVEFSDFLCGFCGRHYQQTLTPLLNDYDGLVRYVYRDFPGVGGENAVSSALAAECANDQGMFWEYHSLLFDNQEAISVSLAGLNNVLLGFAEDLELDMDVFSTCLQDRVHIGDIFQDRTDAQNIGARGTPAFLINGNFVSGAQPYEIFASLIDAELQAAGIDPSQSS